MILPVQYAENLNLESGKLCLDFANAADQLASTHPEERLDNYEKLILWAKNVGLLTEIKVAQLLRDRTA